MANKYIRHGETFNGDGTSSAAATSNGGVGAWNNINVFEGTAPAYGALAAGDVVYIRSKDAAGANITRTLAASTSLGSAAANSTNWVTWLLDDGAVWSGINGILTYLCPSSYGVTFRNYNDIYSSGVDRFVVADTATGTDGKTLVNFSTHHTSTGLFIDNSANTTSGGSYLRATEGGGIVLCDAHIKWKKFWNQAVDLGNNVRLINPDIELTTTQSITGFIKSSSYGANFTIVGGRVRGAGAVDPTALCSPSSTGGTLKLIGTQVPKAMKLVSQQISGAFVLDAIGLDNGAGGYFAADWGDVTSRSDAFPPTLSSYMELSVSTPWSWKVYPKYASRTSPAILPVIKLYADTPAARTIGIEVAVADSISTANTASMWLEVSYTDNATGEVKTISTKTATPAALSGSTAPWNGTSGSSVSWGPINCIKKKIAITTPTAIKQDTQITATLVGAWASVTADDIMFACPDLTIS